MTKAESRRWRSPHIARDRVIFRRYLLGEKRKAIAKDYALCRSTIHIIYRNQLKKVIALVDKTVLSMVVPLTDDERLLIDGLEFEFTAGYPEEQYVDLYCDVLPLKITLPTPH
jgi:hypothetical protein